MSDSQTPPPNPQLSGDEPSLGGETASQLTGFEPRLGSYLPITLAGLPALAQVRMAETLARAGSQPAKQLLYRALLEGDEAIGQAAAQALGRIKDTSALELFSRVIHNTDFGTLIRVSVLKAAGQIGGRKGLSVLLDVENDPDLAVREARVRALGNLGARLEDEDSQLRIHVLEALTESVRDSYPDIREVSVVMIGWIGGEEAHAILRRLISNNRHLEVVQAAKRLLPPELESQEQYTYLQHLRRYRGAIRQTFQLAAWLVRDDVQLTLLKTLIWALLFGVVSYIVIRWVNWDLLAAIPSGSCLNPLFGSLICVVTLGVPIWLFATTIKATDRYRLNEQFAVIRITDLDRSMLFTSYMLASFHYIRPWLALMAGVLIAWAVTGYAMKTWIIVLVWSGLGVLTVPLGVIYTLAPRRRESPKHNQNFVKGIGAFIELGLFSSFMLVLLWRRIEALMTWASSSLIRSLALLSICLVTAVAVIFSLLNRFKRWS